MTNVITGVVSISSGTAAQWAVTTKIVPQGVYMYETDTGKAKIADGSSLYSALSYHVGPIALLGIGNGLAASGGNLVVQNADSSITVASGGISVNTVNLSGSVADHGSITSGTVTLDRSVASTHKLTVGGALTLAFSNWPATGKMSSMALELVNGAAFTVTWPTINWITSTGAITTSFSALGLTLQTSGVDWFSFFTIDGGTTVYGKVVR